MSGLRECPWCGEKPDPVESLRTDSGNAGQIGKWAWIECGCGVCAPDVRAQYGNAEGWQDAAAEEWNRRAPSSITREEVARLVEAAQRIADRATRSARMESDGFDGFSIGSRAGRSYRGDMMEFRDALIPFTPPQESKA